MSFARARAVADAVLFEGYLLYPYRASAPKNRLRWQFGVVAPRSWATAGGSDPWRLETCCLLEANESARIVAQLRFLQLRRRSIEHAGADGLRPVESLEVDGRVHLPWDEGEVREVPLEAPVIDGEETVLPFHFSSQVDREPLRDVNGATVGQIVRQTWPLAGVVRVRCQSIPGGRPLYRLRAGIENTTGWDDPGAPRDQALAASLLGTHLLLAADGGRFLSLTDPPDWAATAAAACKNTGLYPVLVSEEPTPDVVLAAPFILHDHPRIAPESPGDFYDATEIDELLTLRTLTLSDAEKREVRATDARGAALLDRVEQMPPETLARLHGAVRELRPVSALAPGSRVRLRPGPRRTDAQDMFLAGMTATVEAVMQDVDGRDCLAVTVDDDPASELFRVHGRYLYFYPDEVEST
jgi:hypothetical protein